MGEGQRVGESGEGQKKRRLPRRISLMASLGPRTESWTRGEQLEPARHVVRRLTLVAVRERTVADEVTLHGVGRFGRGLPGLHAAGGSRRPTTARRGRGRGNSGQGAATAGTSNRVSAIGLLQPLARREGSAIRVLQHCSDPLGCQPHSTPKGQQAFGPLARRRRGSARLPADDALDTREQQSASVLRTYARCVQRFPSSGPVPPRRSGCWRGPDGPAEQTPDARASAPVELHRRALARRPGHATPATAAARMNVALRFSQHTSAAATTLRRR